MIYLLVVLPWALTVGFLLYIMFTNREVLEEGYDEFDLDDFLTERQKQGIQTLVAAIYNEKAYWVHQNVFYEAETTLEPDWETARPLDTEKLSAEELNGLMSVLDEIKDNER